MIILEANIYYSLFTDDARIVSCANINLDHYKIKKCFQRPNARNSK